MSRVAFALVAATSAALFVVPASAGQPANSPFGLPIAPNAGKASIHQWGGIDDAFAVNPDGDEAPARAPHKVAPMAQSQDDQVGDDPGDPDTDHADEILPT
jgi:hypothetical protein